MMVNDGGNGDLWRFGWRKTEGQKPDSHIPPSEIATTQSFGSSQTIPSWTMEVPYIVMINIQYFLGHIPMAVAKKNNEK